MKQNYFDSRDFYKAAFRLLIEASPKAPVLNLAVSCFGLTKDQSLQLGMFENIERKEKLVKSLDSVNEKWGGFTIGSARSFDGARVVLDRIAFACPQLLEQ